MLERLLHATAVGGAGVGCAMLLAAPDIPIHGWGHPLLAGTVHLFTVGGVLSAAYVVQQRRWRQAYGPAAPWQPLLFGAWLFHTGGLCLLAFGLLWGDARLASWGGHYGVPTGVVLWVVHGWVAAVRRKPGAPRAPATHLPGLGLAVAMALGALLVMDAHTGRYGVYAPDTILAHALAAGFLFVLPLVLLPAAPESDAPASAGAGISPQLRWYAATACGTGGVLLVVLAQADVASARLLPAGLALLGALLVWIGLPGSRDRHRPLTAGIPRMGRLACGVLIGYAALRTARGLAPGDALWLGKVGVLLFLLGVALPELLALLERHANATHMRSRQALWLAGTAALLAGQLWHFAPAVQAGTSLWVIGLLWHARSVERRRRSA